MQKTQIQARFKQYYLDWQNDDNDDRCNSEVIADFTLICVDEALNNAAENAMVLYHDGFHKKNTSMRVVNVGADNISVDKQSILNVNN